MPGPGARGKKPKPKPKPTGSNNADKWHTIVDTLCKNLDIPELTTRAGLKRVHAHFDDIHKRLEKLYQNCPHDNVRGGVIGIYAKMCADSIIRDKLFAKGLLDRIMPLINIDNIRHLALQSLTTVTHHGGASIRVAIAKQTPALLKVLKDHPDDPKVAELVVVTLAHSIGAVVSGDEKPSEPKLIKSLNVANVLQVMAESTKNPAASPLLINHVVGLFSTATLHAADACKSSPSIVNFLIAGLRSKEWVTKCSCLGGLLRLHRLGAESDQRILDPNKFMKSIQRGFPNHLSDVMMDYGPMRCETYMTLRTTSEFQKAMMDCAQNRNLYVLGLKLAEFILRTEFSIADGEFRTEDPVTGKLVSMDLGLPFTMWAEALPHCAKAIRGKGKPNELDLADIIDIKYRIMKAKALVRSPDTAYFYYTITLSADNVDGLRAAKKGMKCKNTTPFVRFQMMQRAVEHAGDMGIRILQDSPATGDKKWEEGIAFLMSALEDAKTYVEQAPPDNRHMKNVLYWYILLTLTVSESDIRTDLRELQPEIDKLKIADEISTFIGVPPPKTNLRLAQQDVVNRYPAALKEFSEVILKAADTTNPTVTPEKLADELAAWLEDNGDGEPRDNCLQPKVTKNRAALYRCSWCGNPSAMLKKCELYCDAGCQNPHWKEHKKHCTRDG
ncbi:hypothetical protein BD779DRAFT_1529952 [Infundibulicybe gibba]|nr:hypothetical protein BD779DRAFT_1529952 [Infundibulicybe gibba]